MLFREALKTGFYELQDARDYYREITQLTGEGMHKDLVLQFIEIQALLLTPFTPHWSEYIWQKVLRKPGSAISAPFPSFKDPIDQKILDAQAYIRTILHDIRSAETAALRRQKKKGGNNNGGKENSQPSEQKKETKGVMKIFVASKFPEWQEDVIRFLKQVYLHDKKDFPADLIAQLKAAKLANKQTMPFVSQIRKQVELNGPTAFDRAVLFDELETLKTTQNIVCKSLNLTRMEIYQKEAVEDPNDLKKAQNALPGNPTYAISQE